jgi:hypothetical protein
MRKRLRKKLFKGSRAVWKNKYRPIWRKLWLEFAGAPGKHKQWHQKLLWIATLKVGDLVNDCRYRNLRIKEIYETPYDLDLTLEDGSGCSAGSCCSPPMTSEQVRTQMEKNGQGEADILKCLQALGEEPT